MVLIAAVSAVLAAGASPEVNSIGMRMMPVEAGTFLMGQDSPVPDDLTEPLTYYSREMLRKRFPTGDSSRFRLWLDHARRGDFDEKPLHRVRITHSFRMSAFEVTNAQYEQFDPGHKALRGKHGFSRDDDEAVVFVTWYQAKAFTDWLSKKEGKPYRLPTEAEWEYAARAGTTSLYFTGDHLPAAFHKNVRNSTFDQPRDVVPLTIGQTPPNAWGLYDMHGNVEEWCQDWYGAYEAGEAVDPAGRASGDFKVTRSGSHGTPLYFLRSANRMGMVPGAANWMIGFRVVEGEPPATRPLPEAGPLPFQQNVSQRGDPLPAIDPARPHFEGPRQFIRIPPHSHGPLYSHHNHDVAIAACPNGDLLAIWYTCVQERGRELATAISRLRRGAREWDEASPFWDAPDRNDHAPAMWFDGKKTIYHFNGLGIAGGWVPLAGIVRTSEDNGVTWSRARFVSQQFDSSSMFAQSVARLSDGSVAAAADYSPEPGTKRHSGTGIWFSRDGAQTWSHKEGVIPGVHATFVELKDGRLMAFGRGEAVNGWMPVSHSSDLGRTWQTSASIFPPITGGQRAALVRLKEGPIVLVSFARDVRRFEPIPRGADIRWKTNLFAAVSFDEGKTWPLRKVISDNLPDHAVFTMDHGRVRMSPVRSEPQGYLAITQAGDGMIHLLSSINHYAFNLAWLKKPQADVPVEPLAREIKRAGELTPVLAGRQTAPGKWANDRTDEVTPLDPEKGFTVEARARVPDAGVEQGFELRAFAVSGPRLLNRYAIRVSTSTVDYWDGARWNVIRKGLNNTDSPHAFRLAVRPDTAVQVYRDGELLAALDADLGNDLAQAARGSHFEWAAYGNTSIDSVSFDCRGAFRP